MNNAAFNEKLEKLSIRTMGELMAEIKTSGLDEVLVWTYIQQIAQEAYKLGREENEE